MNPDTKLTVREVQLEDIYLLADYWFSASKEFLKGMGADINKLPSRDAFLEMINLQIITDYPAKTSYTLIWEEDEKPIGHTNVNPISYGHEAKMHLHLWHPSDRKKGRGTQLILKSLPFYFENLRIKTLICEPYSLNPAPNRTLEKTGFIFEKCYYTIPGSLNFEQEVNRWVMTSEQYKKTY